MNKTKKTKQKAEKTEKKAVLVRLDKADLAFVRGETGAEADATAVAIFIRKARNGAKA